LIYTNHIQINSLSGWRSRKLKKISKCKHKKLKSARINHDSAEGAWVLKRHITSSRTFSPNQLQIVGERARGVRAFFLLFYLYFLLFFQCQKRPKPNIHNCKHVSIQNLTCLHVHPNPPHTHTPHTLLNQYL